MKFTLRTKRIYDEPEVADGFRLLVDRLWPRGTSKAEAHVDLWAKEIAPSTELRKWFHAHRDQFDEFASKYHRELKAIKKEVIATMEAIDDKTVTLLSAVKDLEASHVSVLQKFLVELGLTSKSAPKRKKAATKKGTAK